VKTHLTRGLDALERKLAQLDPSSEPDATTVVIA
jgi:hypothetical protein